MPYFESPIKFYSSFLTHEAHNSHFQHDFDKESCPSISPNQEASPNGTLVAVEKFIKKLEKLNEDDSKSVFNESTSPVQVEPESFKIKKRRQSGEYYEEEGRQLDSHKIMMNGVKL